VSYKITKSEPVGRVLKRVAAGQLKRAQRTLETLNAIPRSSHTHGASGGDFAQAVHETRSRFKKMRGLLRLARHGLGRKRFRRENDFFRDAGRQIRAVRDAAALIEALDRLTAQSFKGQKTQPPPVITELRRLLVRDAQRLARRPASGIALARTARRLGEELKRVEAWKLNDFSWKDARRARRRGSQACRQAYETALAQPTDENLHEWRKRAKDLWHEMLLLRKRSPKLCRHIDQVEALTAILGEDHDLAMLARAASDRKRALRLLGQPDQLKILLALLSARRDQLQAEAFALAETWEWGDC
jgi:hypothetical protein